MSAKTDQSQKENQQVTLVISFLGGGNCKVRMYELDAKKAIKLWIMGKLIDSHLIDENHFFAVAGNIIASMMITEREVGPITDSNSDPGLIVPEEPEIATE